MINDTQIAELSLKIMQALPVSVRDQQYFKAIVGVIAEFRNAQPAVAARNITDHDVHNLADFIKHRYEITYDTAYIADDLSTWLGEVQLRQVVGLDNDQVTALARYITKGSPSSMVSLLELIVAIRKYLDTQEFTATALPEPNWDSISCNRVQVRTCYLKDDGSVDYWHPTKDYTRPKPPVPDVAIDQSWVANCSEVDITDSVNVIFVSRKTVGYVTFHNAEVFIPIDDFYAKFNYASS